MTEGRGQTTEGGGRKSEVRDQRSGGGGRRIQEIGNRKGEIEIMLG